MENPPKARQVKQKDWVKWVLPLALAVLVSLAGFFPGWIEANYTYGVYPYIALFQRTITGWLPFSLGDLLYFALGAWLLVKTVKTIIALYKRRITRRKTLRRAFRLARLLMWTYVVFSLAWGLNYHRQGPAHQLQLPVGKYSSSELKQLLGEVVGRLNENRLLLSRDTVIPPKTFRQLRQGAVECYRGAANAYPFLAYQTVSVKKSMYSGVAAYLGFTGYYNPFSGEAQLRTRLPQLMKPFVLCHEIGHQLGYAREDEASFAGYLAAAASEDPLFRYSAYLDLYNSIRGRLVYTSFSEGDTAVLPMLKGYHQQLDTLVRYDRRKIAEYFRRHHTPFSEQMSGAVMQMYAQYLRANKQSRGLESYDDVVSLLVAHRRKYGRI